MNKNVKIAAIGGGTGLSTFLRGIKKHTDNITAIVTVCDDGGSSGRLRKDLNIIPPGDIRNCLVALSKAEPIMNELFQYRFENGELEGQNFGNLFIAALSQITNDFSSAVLKASEILAITGKVIPVSIDNIALYAKLEDGYIAKGESNIPYEVKNRKSKIKEVFLEPKTAKATEGVCEAILNADIITFGPGSLYTSIIPNLLIDEVKEAIKNSKGTKIYICNTVTQPGETDNFKVSDHINAIEKHIGFKFIDKCIAFDGHIPDELMNLYKQNGADKIEIDKENLKNVDIHLVNKSNLRKDAVWHDIDELSERIFDFWRE